MVTYLDLLPEDILDKIYFMIHKEKTKEIKKELNWILYDYILGPWVDPADIPFYVSCYPLAITKTFANCEGNSCGFWYFDYKMGRYFSVFQNPIVNRVLYYDDQD